MTPAPSRRYLALFFPLLSADRWRREHGTSEKPLVFIEKQRGAMRIVATDEAALALGIGPGLGLADARARVPDLTAIPHEPAADFALLEAMADDCERYTPSVALDPTNGLILDITGCAHLWSDEASLADHLVTRLSKNRLRVKHAIAETPDRARALARYPEPLPIAALDLDDERQGGLRRAGFHNLADLAHLPRAALAARFEMDTVTKLVRVLGEEDVRIIPRRPPPALFVLCRFAEPVARTSYILENIACLVREAGRDLAERGEGGRRFSISLFRSDGDVRRLTIDAGTATRDGLLVLRLFHERIESLTDPLDPGFGYDALRLDVPVSEPLAPQQTGLGRDQSKGKTDALIDRLGVRLGRKQVRRFVSGNSHIPELAGFTVAAASPSLPFPWPESENGGPQLRPLHFFDPPQPIEVIAEVPEGPPRRFRWRRQSHNVVAHEGPERIAPEWWKRRNGYQPGEAGLTRDYYRVEDSEGRRFWLFRHGLYGTEKTNPDWYLHGCFA